MFIVSRIWAYLDRIFEDVSDVFLGHSSVVRMQLSDNVDDRSTFAQLKRQGSFIAESCTKWGHLCKCKHITKQHKKGQTNIGTNDVSAILNNVNVKRNRFITLNLNKTKYQRCI